MYYYVTDPYTAIVPVFVVLWLHYMQLKVVAGAWGRSLLWRSQVIKRWVVGDNRGTVTLALAVPVDRDFGPNSIVVSTLRTFGIQKAGLPQVPVVKKLMGIIN